MDETRDAESPPRDAASAAEAWSEPPIRGHRSTTDRYVAGVLGGLGERFDIDPTILRVATVAAAVVFRDSAPLVVPALYALGWIVIPESGERSLYASFNEKRSLQEIAGALIGAALVVFVLGAPNLWIAGALAAAAWLLLAQRGPDEPSDDEGWPAVLTEPVARPNVPPSDTVADSGHTIERSARWGRTRRGVTEPLRTLRLRPRREPRPKREPALWPLTLALLVTFAVICVAIDNTSDPGLDPAIFVNGALLIIGGVLAISAWRGRAGWTALMVVPLIPLWIAFSAADIGRYEGTGSRSIDIAAPAADGVSVEHGYGDLRIFVSEEAVPQDQPLKLKTAMTAGTTTIDVPDNAPIMIRTRAGVGAVTVEGAGSPWRIDNATAINGQRSRSYSPVVYECFTEQYSPTEMLSMFREWSTGTGRTVVLHDFADPDTALVPDVQEFLAFYLPQKPVPPEDGDRVLWSASWDDIGRPCDPDEPFTEAGTIEIDATIGLGEIHIVRHH